MLIFCSDCSLLKELFISHLMGFFVEKLVSDLEVK